MNPLLDFSGLPRFDAFKPDYVTPAVDELLAAGRAVIERLVAADAAPAPLGKISSCRFYGYDRKS